MNKKWKRGYYSWYHRNTKDRKRLLWTIICGQIGQPRRNKFLDIKTIKTDAWRNRESEHTNYTRRLNQKTSQHTKVQDQMASLVSVYQILKIELILFVLKLFQKTKEERTV